MGGMDEPALEKMRPPAEKVLYVKLASALEVAPRLGTLCGGCIVPGHGIGGYTGRTIGP